MRASPPERVSEAENEGRGVAGRGDVRGLPCEGRCGTGSCAGALTLVVAVAVAGAVAGGGGRAATTGFSWRWRWLDI